jgi:hypothetical protein
MPIGRISVGNISDTYRYMVVSQKVLMVISLLPGNQERIDIPLKSQVQEDEEYSHCIACPVLSACIFRGHRSKTRSCNNNPHETGHEHATAGVDFVV